MVFSEECNMFGYSRVMCEVIHQFARTDESPHTGSMVQRKFTAVHQNPQDAAIPFAVVLASGQVARHQLDFFCRRAARQDSEVQGGYRLRATRLGADEFLDDR